MSLLTVLDLFGGEGSASSEAVCDSPSSLVWVLCPSVELSPVSLEVEALGTLAKYCKTLIFSLAS